MTVHTSPSSGLGNRGVDDLVTDVTVLPLAPKNPLPYRQRLHALRAFHTGQEMVRDAGGPVTRVTFGPKWLIPPVVLATSPKAARDVLGRKDAFVDKHIIHREMRQLLGENLFDLMYERWLPRRRALQPIFTKQHVRAFGGHMSQSANVVATGWADGVEIDLDAECRRLTLRALGRSVLGLDLDERADAVAEPLRIALTYVADRALWPIRAPRWLPTPARHRARAARATLYQLAGEILQACRSDPNRDAPLVRALIAATDPASGRALSDADICNELIVFMLGGHDTTATTLAYALWALGRHRDIQDRVVAEVAGSGDRELTPDDVPRLGYTVQVLHEALRLCPPAAAVGRMATRDIEVGGYRVEAGTMLAVGTYALHRDPALWDDPLAFDPDRFSPENSKGRDRWQFIPFGAGPRSCIGDHFAILEATLALATIVRRAEILSLDDDFPLATPFTMVAAAPIRAHVNVRTC
jgi:cytochrome P450